MNKDFWKKVLVHTGLYYTVFSLSVLLVYILRTIDNIYSVQFSAARIIFIPFFCFAFAIGNLFQSLEKPNSFVKLLVHAILTIGGFFAFIYSPMVADGKYQAQIHGHQYENINPFVVLGGVIIVYAVGYGTYFLIHSLKAKKKNKESEYKSVYNKKK